MTTALTVWRPQPDSVYHMDALTLMHQCAPESVDAIITDLPYGTTACSWDMIIPFAELWAAVKHCLKPRGVFVTTASQPFTSALVMSNPACFRYEWVWDKVKASGFLDAQRKPLKQHESILIFAEDTPNYYPQLVKGRRHSIGPHNNQSTVYSSYKQRAVQYSNMYYPKSIISFSIADTTQQIHPTQKSTLLYEYLIRTYTQPGELVLDPTCGSGTTGLAARNTGRRYILGDSSAEYAELARLRITGTGIDMLNAKTPEPLESLPLFARAVNA